MAVALRHAFPTATIGWVVEGRSADVLQGHRAIDRVFRLRRGWATRLADLRSLRRDLVGFAADVAIDMQGLLKSAIATRLSSAPLRIGQARPAARECSWLATTHHVLTDAPHVVDRNCQLLAPLGITVDQPRFAMPSWPASRERMTALVASLGLDHLPVIINPGAGWPSKIWAEERFATLSRRLLADHGRRSVVVWGGDRERAMAERIATAGHGVMAPQTSLQDLAELCRLSAVFISSDTGPLHLAAAVGTPCVGLFGPVPASRNGPYGAGHVCVEPALELRPAWNNRKRDTLAMAGIGVEEVVAAVGPLLARATQRRAG